MQRTNLPCAKGQARCSRVLFGLRGALCAGDRDDVPVASEPSERDLPWCLASGAADVSEFANQRSGGAEIRGFEQIFIRTDAIFWPPAVVVLSGEDAFPNGAPGKDRDSLAFAIRQDLRLDLPFDHVVPHMVRQVVGPRELGTRLITVLDR